MAEHKEKAVEKNAGLHPKLIIAGAPASGKGTQCELIHEKYGCVHISTGDLLRDAVKAGTALGKVADGYMKKGELVPDDIVIGLVKERLAQPDCKAKGWLLDGFPRTKTQAQALADAGIKPDRFISLDVPDAVVIERAVGRRMDSKTGTIYHLKFYPPPANIPADRLIQRKDDTEETMKNRLVQFHKYFDEVSTFYHDINFRVQDRGTKDATFAVVRKAIESFHPKLIIAGAPAAGKGTQCEFIVAKYGTVHISTGDLLRDAVKAGTPLGVQADEYMKKGALVPDELIIGIVKDRLAKPDCKEKGWLLDGFPRTKPQAKALADAGIKADLFVLLDVPDEAVIERAVGRRMDSQTGKIYHVKFNPPPADIPADRLIQRKDDTEETMKNRLTQFHKNIQEVVGFYETILATVKDQGTKELNFAAVERAIEAIPMK